MATNFCSVRRIKEREVAFRVDTDVMLVGHEAHKKTNPAVCRGISGIIPTRTKKLFLILLKHRPIAAVI